MRLALLAHAIKSVARLCMTYWGHIFPLWSPGHVTMHAGNFMCQYCSENLAWKNIVQPPCTMPAPRIAGDVVYVLIYKTENRHNTLLRRISNFFT